MPSPQPSVLIVDPVPESRGVLREALLHSGIASEGVSSPAFASLRLRSEAHAAALIDLDDSTLHELWLLTREAHRGGVALFAVGTNRPPLADPALVFVRKPYHYRELILKIQDTLGGEGPSMKAVA